MDKTRLFEMIADSIRQQILSGVLQPGDNLPPVREMAARWECAPGTVQHAYQQLTGEGLVVGRAGQGTRVTETALQTAQSGQHSSLRRAALIHQAESFLLGVLTAGYTPEEAEGAVRLAMDRWRSLASEPAPAPAGTLRFAGSHDPAVALLASHFGEIIPDYTLHVTFCGSLGGLMALARGEADLAGCHLWDEETNTYNAPFVRRLLPGRNVALLTLAHRRLGLILAPGNPNHVAGLADLARPGLRFINRQQGAGTRVWLDAQLRRAGIVPDRIQGYEHTVITHSEVASAVATGYVDIGLGLEAAALTYGLDFIPLTTERYDLAIPVDAWAFPPVQALAAWLVTDTARAAIRDLGGYDTARTGAIAWIG